MPRELPGAIRILVAGTSITGWTEVDLDSDIFTPADAWQVRARSPEPTLVSTFTEGQKVDIYVGDDRQLAGVVDDVRLRGDRRREVLELSGRDLGAFLVDCEAGHFRASKYTIVTLAKKLLRPTWGVRNVLTSFEQDRKLALGKKDRKSRAGTTRRRPPIFGDAARASTTVDPGKRVAQILDERTRQLAITWWMTPGGDLFLGKPNYVQEPSYRFVCYRAGTSRAKRLNNVESWEVVRSMSDRYSEITVAAQGSAAGGWLTKPTSTKGAKFSVTVKDADLIARGVDRKLILTDSDVGTRAEAQRRAESEMGHRRLQGLTIRITVPGFGQEPRLFAIDTLASVTIETANVNGLFYITQRRFTESRGQRRTSLTLHQPSVWLA